MAYATTAQLAEYLGVQVADLPDDADRLLDRASELIDYYTLFRIDEDDNDQTEAARQATMAQYEWWAEIGDELGIMSEIMQMSIGSFSTQLKTGGNREMSQVAPRAKQYLLKEGLTYRGVASI